MLSARHLMGREVHIWYRWFTRWASFFFFLFKRNADCLPIEMGCRILCCCLWGRWTDFQPWRASVILFPGVIILPPPCVYVTKDCAWICNRKALDSPCTAEWEGKYIVNHDGCQHNRCCDCKCYRSIEYTHIHLYDDKAIDSGDIRILCSR